MVERSYWRSRADAEGVAPGPDRAVDLLRDEAAAVGVNTDVAGAGGRGGADGVEGAAVGCVAPNDDTAIIFDGGKRIAGGRNHLIAGSGGFAGGAVGAKAPGKDGAIASQCGEGLLVGGDGQVSGAGGRAGLRTAVSGVTPHQYRAVVGERSKCAEVAELLAGDAQSVGAGKAGAGGRALAGQRVAGRNIEIEQLHGGAGGVGGRDIDIFVHGGADPQLATDDAGGGVEGHARRQHTIGADHQILDGVEVGVGVAGGARDAEGVQRLVQVCPISDSTRVVSEHIVDPHLHTPLAAHRYPDGQEGIAIIKSAGEGIGSVGGRNQGAVVVKRQP